MGGRSLVVGVMMGWVETFGNGEWDVRFGGGLGPFPVSLCSFLLSIAVGISAMLLSVGSRRRTERVKAVR